ncbi:MAG: RsmB/NOP family class I SAM-dependent RNA methyltransferase [Deltaproteobacteria bacterium]|nr:MAG: RsmB/NOP family class I SAM-dependent RNA methyltransferase [Deltaproteobacteria bacterium]
MSVQDETSQLAGKAVAPQVGDRVLDACAGSGTKSRQIRESGEGFSLVSMDVDERRLRLSSCRENSLVADGLATPFRGEVFDKILVDAPCSSLGIIRKHPEIKWRRKESDIALFGRTQRALVKGLWGNLKRGGRLIYSVCSFEPEETTEVVGSLAKELQFVLENPFPFLFNKEYFLSLPSETGMDGFFIARLRKL